MTNTIFLLKDDGDLIPLIEQDYESEYVLQEMLSNFPELLLFGDERTPYSNLILIKREQGIPSADGGGAWFYLDHLFVDQDGIFTLVEAKRRGDTRGRREVIAQMLDYATNGLAFWTIEDLKKNFLSTQKELGNNPDEVMKEFLGQEGDIDSFWIQAESNLRNERIRMVFVADEISPEMKRIIGFLNRQLKTVSICAIELRQFIGGNLKAFVPEIIGSGFSGGMLNNETIKNQWNETSFFEELNKNAPESVPVAKEILDWGIKKGNSFWWGKGKKTGSFAPLFEFGGIQYYPTFVWTTGVADIQFQYLQLKPPFDQIAYRKELLTRLNSIPGINIPLSGISRRPSFPLKTLLKPEARKMYLEILNWIYEEAKKTSTVS